MIYVAKSQFALNSGLSTLDFLVGFLILTLVSAISVPRFVEILVAHKLSHEVSVLETNLNMLSLRASQEEKDVRLSVRENYYDAKYIEGDGNNPNTQLVSHFLNSPLHFILPPSNTQSLTLTFYTSGVTTPTTLVLSNGNKTCKLKISLRGRVTTLC